MSSLAPLKRRKLNGLSKPFVSPLKSARTPHKEQNATTSDKRPYTPSTLAHTITVAASPPSVNTQPTIAIPAAVKTPAARKQFSSTPYSSRRSNPAETAAQKALSALDRQIKLLKDDIDALTQAAHLLASPTDAALAALILKWRGVSQLAAEEIFGIAKERVCRMGGVAAWRDDEKKKFERSHGLGDFAPEPPEEDNKDCEFDSQGKELPEKEQEWRLSEKRRARREAEEAADVDVDDRVVEGVGGGGGKDLVWQERGADDDAFTMDMMLRSMNIELGVIGYDRAEQRWETGE